MQNQNDSNVRSRSPPFAYRAAGGGAAIIRARRTWVLNRLHAPHEGGCGFLGSGSIAIADAVHNIRGDQLAFGQLCHKVTVLPMPLEGVAIGV